MMVQASGVQEAENGEFKANLGYKARWSQKKEPRPLLVCH
jgi:hypothetical protein